MERNTIFIIVWVLLAGLMLIVFYKRGKKALSIFPDLDSVNVLYRDKTASGYSKQSLKAKAGGARSMLDIIVTDTELWLKSKVLFASISQKADLLHKIPLGKIIEISQDGKRLTLAFTSESGTIKQIVIVSKKPEDLLKAVNKKNYSHLRV